MGSISEMSRKAAVFNDSSVRCCVPENCSLDERPGAKVVLGGTTGTVLTWGLMTASGLVACSLYKFLRAVKVLELLKLFHDGETGTQRRSYYDQCLSRQTPHSMRRWCTLKLSNLCIGFCFTNEAQNKGRTQTIMYQSPRARRLKRDWT